MFKQLKLLFKVCEEDCWTCSEAVIACVHAQICYPTVTQPNSSEWVICFNKQIKVYEEM